MQKDHLSDNRGGQRLGAKAQEPGAPSALSRRQFLGRVGGVTALTMAVGAVGGPARLGSIGAKAEGEEVGPVTAEERREQAYDVRHQAALAQKNRPLPDHPTNGDEERYATQIGSYSKALPHDALGEVDLEAYEALLHALTTGESAAFEAIPMGGTVALVNPLAALAFVLAGADSHHLGISAPPAFDSEAEAGEIAELYWQALTRDVPFSRYGTEPLTRAAMQDLAQFSAFHGVEADTLFRGLTPGDATGPYISQFLMKAIPFGSQTLVQTYRTAQAGDDHLTTYATWLDIQNGVPASTASSFDPVPRYLRTGRDLAEFVHGCQSGCPQTSVEGLSASAFDGGFLTGVTAALILLGFGSEAVDTSNPSRHLTKQGAFITFGAVHVLDLVTRVIEPALKAAWYQKWMVHRRLRPEEYAGRVHNHQQGKARYPVHPTLLGSQAVDAVVDVYGSYLLPMAYPEGCPAHPAYPSGHATVAGACVTMLKAFFNESFPIPQPQVASDDGLELVEYQGTLTVGGELDKLASNVAMGRVLAGVHWRSDAAEGLKLGEAVAISLLRDLTATYPEDFRGFSLTKFDGTPITI
jgi:membrane-associated phospholipid phosphatase